MKVNLAKVGEYYEPFFGKAFSLTRNKPTVRLGASETVTSKTTDAMVINLRFLAFGLMSSLWR